MYLFTAMVDLEITECKLCNNEKTTNHDEQKRINSCPKLTSGFATNFHTHKHRATKKMKSSPRVS